MLPDNEIFGLAEPFGAFQYGNAQRGKRVAFDRTRFDAGEMPTQTRIGDEVLHVYDSGVDCTFPITAWIKNYDGSVTTVTYTANGYAYGEDYPCKNDLFYMPKIVHKIGNRYLRMNTNEYILGYIGNGKVILMNTKSGRRFAEPTAVDNALKLSKAEWDTLTLGCGDDFKLITP